LNDRLNKGVGMVDEFHPDILFWSQKVRLMPKEKVMADIFLLRHKRYIEDKIIPGE